LATLVFGLACRFFAIRELFEKDNCLNAEGGFTNVTVKNFLTVAVLFNEKYSEINERAKPILLKFYHCKQKY
jgi:hypothetical protein